MIINNDTTCAEVQCMLFPSIYVVLVRWLCADVAGWADEHCAALCRVGADPNRLSRDYPSARTIHKNLRSPSHPFLPHQPTLR